VPLLQIYDRFDGPSLVFLRPWQWARWLNPRGRWQLMERLYLVLHFSVMNSLALMQDIYRWPQCMRFQARSCSQYNPILVTTSVAAMPPASVTSPVISQAIRKVSNVPVMRQVMALATLRR
jgi:hypothetical protein